MVDPLLLAVTPVGTLNEAGEILTNATGFFYERDGRLFLITNRHVVISEEAGHRPHSLSINLHIDADNIAATSRFLIPLYDAQAAWTQVTDEAGMVDVVAIPLDRSALPPTVVYYAFTPAHLVQPGEFIEVGTSLLVVGFPLGFHDSVNHLPVARQAIVSSAFGMRFQGNGYFLTDGRLHRGTSGAPVVAAMPPNRTSGTDLAWRLLGIHAARLDVNEPDLEQDDRLGLNCAWYADALGPLTEQPPAETDDEASAPGSV